MTEDIPISEPVDYRPLPHERQAMIQLALNAVAFAGILSDPDHPDRLRTWARAVDEYLERTR